LLTLRTLTDGVSRALVSIVVGNGGLVGDSRKASADESRR
jgi:hypothetical protein